MRICNVALGPDEGESLESGGIRRLTITLPDALAAELKREVERQRRPTSWVIRDAIRMYLGHVTDNN